MRLVSKVFISSKQCHFLFMPAFVRAFLFKSSTEVELSYKVKKEFLLGNSFAFWGRVILMLFL